MDGNRVTTFLDFEHGLREFLHFWHQSRFFRVPHTDDRTCSAIYRGGVSSGNTKSVSILLRLMWVRVLSTDSRFGTSISTLTSWRLDVFGNLLSCLLGRGLRHWPDPNLREQLCNIVPVVSLVWRCSLFVQCSQSAKH